MDRGPHGALLPVSVLRLFDTPTDTAPDQSCSSGRPDTLSVMTPNRVKIRGLGLGVTVVAEMGLATRLTHDTVRIILFSVLKTPLGSSTAHERRPRQPLHPSPDGL
jgi:hypothetical protein